MKYRVNIQTVTKQWRDASVIIEANSAGEAEEKALGETDTGESKWQQKTLTSPTLQSWLKWRGQVT